MECLGERTSVFVIVVHPFVRCSAYNHFVIEIDKSIGNFTRLICNKSERENDVSVISKRIKSN